MVGFMVWIVLVVLAGGVCLAVICALRKPMHELLRTNSYICPAREFYLRTFTVLIILAALATVSNTDTPDNDKAFMEYIWWIVNAAQPLFMALSFWLLGYAALLTLLFVVLGRYRD